MIAVALGLSLVACQPRTGGGKDATDKEPQIDITEFVMQWTDSKHEEAVVSAAEEEFCVGCHDGGAFAESATDPARLRRDWIVATDCRACHTDRGTSIVDAGETELPYGATVSGGKGALCMTCHNTLRAADINDATRSAPHNGPQTEVLKAIGGLKTSAMQTSSTAEHAGIKDSCVSCHMSERDGIPSHLMTPGTARTICARCHSGLKDFAREAKEDYDGDGDREALRDELQGLMSLVASASVGAVSNATTMTVSGGDVVFKSEDTTLPPSAVTDKAYVGAYNYFLLLSDGSMGVHNPAFAVSLMQQAYKEITGRDVPGARILGPEE